MKIKDFEKAEERITDKIIKYERKYIRSEDGNIGFEIAYMVHLEFEKLKGKFTRSLERKKSGSK